MSGSTNKNIDISDGGFSKRLKRLRMSRGLTKVELAEKAGLSDRGIHDIERGRRPRVLEKTVYLLANALGVSYEDLLNGPSKDARPSTGPSWIRRPVIFLGIIAAMVIIVVIAVVGKKTARR